MSTIADLPHACRVRDRYPVKSWRMPFDVATTWAAIALPIALVINVSWWLYPVAVVLIANRMLALSLLGHEAIHGNLHKNRRINDWVGRYLCSFPTTISLAKYRRLHFLHHSTVGSDKWDPDRHLYAYFPLSLRHFVAKQLISLVTLKTFISFMSYYTEFPELLQRKRNSRNHLLVLTSKSDFIPFLAFFSLLLALCFVFDFYTEVFAFWLVPTLAIIQPYVLLMGGLQHGPIRNDRSGGVSRTITGSKIYMWLLLPCNINFHAEHHYDPTVPHYHLKHFSEEIKSSNIPLWRTSYAAAVNELFNARSPLSYRCDTFF